MPHMVDSGILGTFLIGRGGCHTLSTGMIDSDVVKHYIGDGVSLKTCDRTARRTCLINYDVMKHYPADAANTLNGMVGRIGTRAVGQTYEDGRFGAADGDV